MGSAMEQVTLWYLCEKDELPGLSEEIRAMGLSINNLHSKNFKEANIIDSEINLFIIDLIEISPVKILEMLAGDQRLQSFLKFVIINKKDLKDIKKTSFNLMHVEFISRPVEKSEFLLLLEKSIVVERYREIMKFVSSEAESRIEAYEGILDINRKKVFETDKEKSAFEKILAYEKNLMKEQVELSKAIRDFTFLRQSEIFDMKSRINAEEMLAELRRRELLDAKNIINAQDSVLNFSAKELNDAKRIINASEQMSELGRMEALNLHDNLKKEKELNKSLCEEIEKLLQENDALKTEIALLKKNKG
jgi:hypothetical protein